MSLSPEAYEKKINELEEQLSRAKEFAKEYNKHARESLIAYAMETYVSKSKSGNRTQGVLVKAAYACFGDVEDDSVHETSQSLPS